MTACPCPSCTLTKRDKDATCDFCAPYNCTEKKHYAPCGPARIWPLIWLMFDAGRLIGAAPAMPRCQHSDWAKRKHRCCIAVDEGGGIFAPPGSARSLSS